MTVLIAGAGIAGLTMGLTLHQLGVPFRIFEAVPKVRPLGVGINLQPSAVRELFDLGLHNGLAQIGVETQDYGFFTRTGTEIWVEPRGLRAGYRWPQYSVHRGKLQMLLLETLMDRAGPDVVETGQRAVGFEVRDGHLVLAVLSEAGVTSKVDGDVLIAADGINSAIRAQLYPDEGPPVWSGALLWRGFSRARPFRTGASMIIAGNDHIRFVCYPISGVDPETGLADINWIAEKRTSFHAATHPASYGTRVEGAKFLADFADWNFGWIDCPDLISSAAQIYEYPMVDRDPVPQWTFGPVTLIGDAAHPAYPVGSNGAGQAIIDARRIGAAFRSDGVGPQAFEVYEAQTRPQMAKVVAANRSGDGPDGIMQMVEDRCQGDFDRMSEVITTEELSAHAARYKSLAGFSVQGLNDSPPILGS